MIAGPPLDRFCNALAALAGGNSTIRFGLAVSGGPDSLALLLLAHASMPDRIEAATFDHGLRPESVAEAEHVAAICRDLGVPHVILRSDMTERTGGSLQAQARGWRYDALGQWCRARELPWLLTAHHADDQAETVLMRLARGSGVAGLAGIRPVRALAGGGQVGRPLLGFAKTDLMTIVRDAGLEAINDPSNRAGRFDRTHARRLLEATGWLDAHRLSATADHMRAAETALVWAADREWLLRANETTDSIDLSVDNLPDEIVRRLVAKAIGRIEAYTGSGGDTPYDGPELTRFIARLYAGEPATLCHVLARPGPVWRFTLAPPRRDAPAAARRKSG